MAKAWSGRALDSGTKDHGRYYNIRHGYGLVLGGTYQYQFGRYERDFAVGQHVAWDAHTDIVLLDC